MRDTPTKCVVLYTMVGLAKRITGFWLVELCDNVAVCYIAGTRTNEYIDLDISPEGICCFC